MTVASTGGCGCAEVLTALNKFKDENPKPKIDSPTPRIATALQEELLAKLSGILQE
jgi:hypothetical protein